MSMGNTRSFLTSDGNKRSLMLVKNKKKTTEPILITENQVKLPTQCYGIVFRKALIFQTGLPDVYKEVTCELLEDGKTVAFDPADNLNGKYAVIAYLSG